MSSQAIVEHDIIIGGVRLAVRRSHRHVDEVVTWGPQSTRLIEDSAVSEPDDAWLRLTDDDARAIYEALADHYGHATNDTRLLRRDYEAERKRVDRFIDHLTGGES